MKVIEYSGDEKPTESAVKIEGTANKWILLDGSEREDIPVGAKVLTTEQGIAAIKRKNLLPADHPLKKDENRIPEGPFPAGSLPGDIRFNDDGSVDYYFKKKWYAYSETNGDPVDPNITPSPVPIIGILPR